MPSRLAAAGPAGGSVYDSLIALGAAGHGLELITRGELAARTYRSLGASFELIA